MKKSIIIKLAFSVFILVSLPIITQGLELDHKYTSIDEVPQETWDKLALKKIYFGHYSVGKNILAGLNLLLDENPHIKLKITSAKLVGSKIGEPGLVEGHVGKNSYPNTKMEAFKEKVEGGLGGSADLAFFKFCFIDFTPETDIKGVFQTYKTTMDDLIKKYPTTQFAVVTTPLTCAPPGLSGIVKRLKDTVKSIIGKLNIYDHTSVNRFNELLVKEYAGKVPLFDLAKYESIKPDGTRVMNTKKGEVNYELYKGYSLDGGHLNIDGMKVIAEQFLLFLASTVELDQE